MWVAKVQDIVTRGISDDVTSTAHSFKSWDSCMANKPCKIIAIVGIVLACLFAFWMISTLIRCCCMGISCLEALCCCCCRPAGSQRYVEKQTPVSPFENPNMYPPTQAPVYQTRPPQQAYFAQNQGYQPVSTSYEGAKGYESSEYHDDENPFDNKYNTNHYRYS